MSTLENSDELKEAQEELEFINEYLNDLDKLKDVSQNLNNEFYKAVEEKIKGNSTANAFWDLYYNDKDIISIIRKIEMLMWECDYICKGFKYGIPKVQKNIPGFQLLPKYLEAYGTYRLLRENKNHKIPFHTFKIGVKDHTRYTNDHFRNRSLRFKEKILTSIM